MRLMHYLFGLLLISVTIGGVLAAARHPGARWGRMCFRLWVILTALWLGGWGVAIYPAVTADDPYLAFLAQPPECDAYQAGRGTKTDCDLAVLSLGAEGKLPAPQQAAPSASLMASRALSYGSAIVIPPAIVLAIGLGLGWAFRGARA